VGLVAGQALFGEAGAVLITAVMSVSLLSSASAMTVVGPRVYFALGRDVSPLRWLSAVTADGTPRNALLLQGVVTSLIIAAGRIDQILQYAGMTLSLMSMLAVSCVVILRSRSSADRDAFRIPWYPLPPLIYIAIMLWTVVWAFRGRPVESALGLLTVCFGGALFQLIDRRAWRHRW
jgi:APA family basic amino acid/polyamine antiporter